MFYVISLYSTYTVPKHHRELEFGVNFIQLSLTRNPIHPYLLRSFYVIVM